LDGWKAKMISSRFATPNSGFLLPIDGRGVYALP
jgi:hypothetical protein